VTGLSIPRLLHAVVRGTSPRPRRERGVRVLPLVVSTEHRNASRGSAGAIVRPGRDGLVVVRGWSWLPRAVASRSKFDPHWVREADSRSGVTRRSRHPHPRSRWRDRPEHEIADDPAANDSRRPAPTMLPRPARPSDRELLDDLRRVHDELDERPSESRYDSHGVRSSIPSVATSHTDAREAVGLPERAARGGLGPTARASRDRPVTRPTSPADLRNARN
jgi:hypothetical protein